jgi:lipopolysaccharide biosynthesis glycosyltransferase
MSTIQVFLGYDTREAVAFHVASHSIHRHSSKPVSITPIMLSQLSHVFNRAKHSLQSTEFSFSRFLVPYLSEYKGWSLFMDSDVLCLDDVATLWELRDDRWAVQVVKHDHVPKEETKFLGAKQTVYEKKNWSSVMLFNNEKCKALTPEYVNTATGLELHRFKWLESDDQIGDIPKEWNHLVDYDPAEPVETLSNLHYTSGGPYFENYRDCGYSQEWKEEFEKMRQPY